MKLAALTTVTHSSAFPKHLLNYSLTAGATLAVLGTGHAAIVSTTGLNLTVSLGSSPVPLDLDGGGNDFHFTYSNYSFSQRALPLGNAQIANAKLALNDPITAGLSWGLGGVILANDLSHTGLFRNARGFLPIRLDPDNNGQYTYGWVDFGANAGTVGTIYGYGYNDAEGGAILAGQVAVPEPEKAGVALALLALGAAGVMRMRKRAAGS